MKLKQMILLPYLTLSLLLACEQNEEELEAVNIQLLTNEVLVVEEIDEEIDLTYFNREPTEWGEGVTGVKTHFKTEEQKIL